jgi:hypothetical protein
MMIDRSERKGERTMKQKTLYTCDYCHTDYADPDEARACEESHWLLKGKDAKIEPAYKPYKMMPDGAPVRLIVTFANGEQVTYRR